MLISFPKKQHYSESRRGAVSSSERRAHSDRVEVKDKHIAFIKLYTKLPPVFTTYHR